MFLVDFLIKKGYQLEKAKLMIKSGVVKVNHEVIIWPLAKIKVSDQIEIKEVSPYVSRGAYKLKAALTSFKINLNDKVVVDLGSSTGGFVQVSLQENAQKVYAVDVGTNQLDYRLRQNPKVVVYEKTHFNQLTSTNFDQKIDFVLCDLAFISLRRVFAFLPKIIQKTTQIITLIKPQFELPKNLILKGGITLLSNHNQMLKNLIDYAAKQGFILLEIFESPIKGQKAKNVEYLAWWKVKNGT